MAAFGIHFGTCSACLAVYKDGHTDVIANDLGDRVTPCVVAFTEYEQSVGAAAKQGIIRNAQNSVCHVKQVIGKDYDDPSVQDYISSWPVSVSNNSGVCQFNVEFKGKPGSFTPVQIATAIYSKVLETAESHGGRGIKDAVLAVPSNFTSDQRQQISEAAGKAGFNVLRIINEPAAATLAYDIGQIDQHEECTVMVLRVGGTSTDATILNIHHGLYKVINSVTKEKYGGDNFTDVLMNGLLIGEFKRQHKCDITDNRRAMTKLRLASERSKHTLSTLANALCAVDSLYDGIDFHYNVSRGRFEILCNNLLQQCVQIIEQCLREAELSKADIHKVILCGGGANIPVLQKTVGDCLKDSKLLTSITTDEVIAIGAAKQAAILVGKEVEEIRINEESCSVRGLSKAISVKVAGESTEPLIILPQFTLIPSRKQHSFTVQSDQTSAKLEIYESDATNHELLAKIVMRDLPVECTIQTHFHLRRDGELHITCHEATNKIDESVTIVIS